VIKKKDLSSEDKKNWEDYIKNPQDIFDKDQKNQINFLRKDRYRFDLHGLSLDEANNKVREIIFSCVEKKYKEILLITGKGNHSSVDKDIYTSKNLGKLKHSVPEFIQSNQELNKLIISINDAEAKDGGEGALVIKLKNL
jgi:DNA-nicking Smr family endonuclease